MEKAASYEQKIIFNKFNSDIKKAMQEGTVFDYGDTQCEMDSRLEHVHKCVDTLQHYIGYDYYRPIEGRGVRRNLKRAVRKSVSWLVKPAMDQQALFNSKTCEALVDLAVAGQRMCSELSSRHLDIKNFEQVCMGEQKKQSGELEELQIRAMALENEIETLKKEGMSDREVRDCEKALSDQQQQQIELLKKTVQKLEGLIVSGGIGEGRVSEGDRNSFIKTYYAQAGEDAIIDYILRVFGIAYESATYLDLGANHAKELSNTYFLYSQWSSGVLVEANPNLVGELTRLRPRDVVLYKCIGTVSGEQVEFFILNGDGLSTTDRKAAEEFIQINPTLRIEKSVFVDTITVPEIIEQHMEGKAPTVLSIDIEGMEESIIRSIDFEKHRPLIIISEMIDYSLRLAEHKNEGVLRLLQEKEYVEYAFTGINSIFVDKRYMDQVFGEKK